MAHAKCTKCGKEQHWYARRGTKLSDLKSDCCNAPLEGLTTGRESRNKGKTYELCGVCGRRGNRLTHPNTDFSVFKDAPKIYPKGTPTHLYHSIIPAGKTWGDFYEMEWKNSKELKEFQEIVFNSPRGVQQLNSEVSIPPNPKGQVPEGIGYP